MALRKFTRHIKIRTYSFLLWMQRITNVVNKIVKWFIYKISRAYQESIILFFKRKDKTENEEGSAGLSQHQNVSSPSLWSRALLGGPALKPKYSRLSFPQGVRVRRNSTTSTGSAITVSSVPIFCSPYSPPPNWCDHFSQHFSDPLMLKGSHL